MLAAGARYQDEMPLSAPALTGIDPPLRVYQCRLSGSGASIRHDVVGGVPAVTEVSRPGGEQTASARFCAVSDSPHPCYLHSASHRWCPSVVAHRHAEDNQHNQEK